MGGGWSLFSLHLFLSSLHIAVLLEIEIEREREREAKILAQQVRFAVRNWRQV